MAQTKIVKKKVRAFPFPIALKAEGTGTAVSGDVLALTGTGFMVEFAGSPLVKVTDRFEFSFTFPVLNSTVAGGAVLVKLYNRLTEPPPGGSTASAGAPPAKVKRLGEFHFRNLSDPSLRVVHEFLARLGVRA